eukprot:scaffold12243_cov116-Isochrysis_galbana.AAC.6
MMISGLDHILISGHRSDDDLRAPDAPAQLLVREDGGAVEEERLGHVDALAKHRLGDEAPLADGRGHADDLSGGGGGRGAGGVWVAGVRARGGACVGVAWRVGSCGFAGVRALRGACCAPCA